MAKSAATPTPPSAGGSSSWSATLDRPLQKAQQYWHRLGPGLITGAADDDPSGIATYSHLKRCGTARKQGVAYSVYTNKNVACYSKKRERVAGAVIVATGIFSASRKSGRR